MSQRHALFILLLVCFSSLAHGWKPSDDAKTEESEPQGQNPWTNIVPDLMRKMVMEIGLPKGEEENAAKAAASGGVAPRTPEEQSKINAERQAEKSLEGVGVSGCVPKFTPPVPKCKCNQCGCTGRCGCPQREQRRRRRRRRTVAPKPEPAKPEKMFRFGELVQEPIPASPEEEEEEKREEEADEGDPKYRERVERDLEKRFEHLHEENSDDKSELTEERVAESQRKIRAKRKERAKGEEKEDADLPRLDMKPGDLFSVPEAGVLDKKTAPEPVNAREKLNDVLKWEEKNKVDEKKENKKNAGKAPTKEKAPGSQGTSGAASGTGGAASGAGGTLTQSRSSSSQSSSSSSSSSSSTASAALRDMQMGVTDQCYTCIQLVPLAATLNQISGSEWCSSAAANPAECNQVLASVLAAFQTYTSAAPDQNTFLYRATAFGQSSHKVCEKMCSAPATFRALMV